jgi:hypothetical protein
MAGIPWLVLEFVVRCWPQLLIATAASCAVLVLQRRRS